MRLDLRAPTNLRQQAASARGIAVQFAAVPALNGTYRCDVTTLAELRVVANDAGSGNGLPFGADFYSHTDIDGHSHAFTADEIQALYRAMRDYVIQLGDFTSGQVTTAPTTPITIS